MKLNVEGKLETRMHFKYTQDHSTDDRIITTKKNLENDHPCPFHIVRLLEAFGV